ncbi:MAG: proline dehydrogenase family protein [Actinomycetota bacterium]|nr:proline dehydrogenase family protein [Actinomycetota bacterium]
MSSVRNVFEQIAKNKAIGSFIAGTPIGREFVHRVAGGEQVEDVIEAAQLLADAGRLISLERAVSGELSESESAVVFADYAVAVSALASAALARISEVVILPEVVLRGSLRSAPLRDLCAQAQISQVSVMIGMGPDDLVDATLELVSGLRAEGFDVGVTLQSVLRRTEDDCETIGGRVCLVKGATSYVALDRFGQAIEVDKSYIRCAKALLRAAAEPVFATQDPRLIEIIQTLTARLHREKGSYEFAMYYGQSTGLQQRLTEAGEAVRVYIPFGPGWFGRLVGGLAERPTGLVPAIRSLLPGA